MTQNFELSLSNFSKFIIVKDTREDRAILTKYVVLSKIRNSCYARVIV